MNKQNVINQQRTRNSAIELCRIISMIMIVGCHFASHGGFDFNKTIITVPRLWWYLIEMGGNFGVVVFVLISGYYLVENNRFQNNIKKILKLWGQVIFYSVVIYIISIVVGINPFSIKQSVKSIFPIISGSWWFATTYFVLFLIHPFINQIIVSLEKRQYQRLLILLLIIWCVVPTFTTYNLGSNELWQFVMIYAVGGYIKLYGKTIKLKSCHFFYLWIAFTIITYISSILLLLLGRTHPLFTDYATYFYRKSSILTILRAICFFMFFEKMTVFTNKCINIIASAAFGVYLIHDSNIIRPLLWKTLFVNAQYQESMILIPYSIGVTLLVFIICTMIDLIRINTVERIYLKKINNSLPMISDIIKEITARIGDSLFGKEE